MKSIKNITLLAMLMVLGACSISKEDQAFLDLVKNKSVYRDATKTELQGKFSSDGQTFTEISADGELDIPFEELSGTTASYIIGKLDSGYKFTTTDGVTGKFSITLFGVPSTRVDMWLK